MSSGFDLLPDDEPRTPSTVDVGRAITDGRRRRRLRRGIGYTSAAAVTALAVAGASIAVGGLSTDVPYNSAATGTARIGASSAPKGQYMIPGTPGWKPIVATEPTTCSLVQLPTPDNAPMALVSSGDPTGQYFVGTSYPKLGRYQAVIWHGGKAENVMLPGDIQESLTDVNSSGTAVGWSYEGDKKNMVQVPYIYRDGKVSKLPGVKSAEPRAINDAGAIVGSDDSAALVWPSATASPIRLPLPAGSSQATAVDIDEDGTVVGTVDMSRPYIWLADGTPRELPMPTIDGKTAAVARAFGIRQGWATGIAFLDDNAAKGLPSGKDPSGKPKRAEAWNVRWNVRTGKVVSVTSGVNLDTGIINAQGWQVGNDAQGQAMLVADGTTVLLPDLSTHTPGGLQNIANSLSDDGRTIGGQSDDKAGVIQPVVWRCK